MTPLEQMRERSRLADERRARALASVHRTSDRTPEQVAELHERLRRLQQLVDPAIDLDALGDESS
jgi:hypothetical protein